MVQGVWGRLKNWLDSDHKLTKLFVSLNYYLFNHKKWEGILALDRKAKFTEIYKNNMWNNEESWSGGGSTLSRTTEIRAQLPELFRRRGIRTFCDAGCGDFNWMKSVDMSGVEYLGVEIVKDLVERNRQAYGDRKIVFMEADVCQDILPKSDLILCREVLFHLSFKEIAVAISKFKKSGSTYLLATHHPDYSENVDIVAGLCRGLNFELSPLNFPKPIEVLKENLSEKCLALWRLEDIDVSESSDK